MSALIQVNIELFLSSSDRLFADRQHWKRYQVKVKTKQATSLCTNPIGEKLNGRELGFSPENNGYNQTKLE